MDPSSGNVAIQTGRFGAPRHQAATSSLLDCRWTDAAFIYLLLIRLSILYAHRMGLAASQRGCLARSPLGPTDSARQLISRFPTNVVASARSSASGLKLTSPHLRARSSG